MSASEPKSEEEIRAAVIGDVDRAQAGIELVEYDPSWPSTFARLEASIREALGPKALLVEHAGSTSVPGLAAKPIVDVVLAVADSADEAAYVPDMEGAGFYLRVREPDWHEHRMFRHRDVRTNVHAFSAGCREIERMLVFRDWLRTHPADRELYERTKRELAAQRWEFVQNYADAKTAVVEDIIARALGDRQPSTSDTSDRSDASDGASD